MIEKPVFLEKRGCCFLYTGVFIKAKEIPFIYDKNTLYVPSGSLNGFP